jgi:hypothetical protein
LTSPPRSNTPLKSWQKETAFALGRRVTTQDVLRAAVQVLLEDETVAPAGAGEAGRGALMTAYPPQDEAHFPAGCYVLTYSDDVPPGMAGEVRVRKSQAELRRGRLLVKSPKSGAGKRIVAIPPTIVQS